MYHFFFVHPSLNGHLGCIPCPGHCKWCCNELSIGILKVKVLAAQSCLTFCSPMGCSPPGSSVHSILQARILERVAISFSRGPSQPRGQTWVSWIAGGFFTVWTKNHCPIVAILFLWKTEGFLPHSVLAKQWVPPSMNMRVALSFLPCYSPTQGDKHHVSPMLWLGTDCDTLGAHRPAPSCPLVPIRADWGFAGGETCDKVPLMSWALLLWPRPLTVLTNSESFSLHQVVKTVFSFVFFFFNRWKNQTKIYHQVSNLRPIMIFFFNLKLQGKKEVNICIYN